MHDIIFLYLHENLCFQLFDLRYFSLKYQSMSSQYMFFFFNFFVGHMSICGATDTPVLDFWWRLLWVSKPEWVLPYSNFAEAYVIIRSLRFTSGATPLPVYNASIAASRLPHMRVSAEVECQDSNCPPPAWQSDALPTRPRRPAFTVHVIRNKEYN